MNKKVSEAINNLKDVLAQEMDFHPQTISLCSFDHYEETSDPNIALDLTVKHGFKSKQFQSGRYAAKLDHRIEGTNTIIEMRHYFDRPEVYTEDDLPEEVCERCEAKETGYGLYGTQCEECFSIVEAEEEAERKHQETEYRNSKI